MNRQFTDIERKLTERNLNTQKNKLNELEEQLNINVIKQNFLLEQRNYQDAVSQIEQTQSDNMFEKSISMLNKQIDKADDKEEITNQIEYNTENHARIIQDRKFKEKWTPYLRNRTDKQNIEVNKELSTDIKITEQIIKVAEDQLENGVEVKTPVGVN